MNNLLSKFSTRIRIDERVHGAITIAKPEKNG